jgi:L-glyceraldehyde 3-phosphate reductase
MFNRWVEDGLLETLGELGIGCIAFSPLAQGLLTNKYLTGAIPPDSRAAKPHGFLKANEVSARRIELARRLNQIAEARGQTLAQMAIAWVLRHPQMTSALVGASKVSQIEDNVAAVKNLTFTQEELAAIEAILKEDNEPPVW